MRRAFVLSLPVSLLIWCIALVLVSIVAMIHSLAEPLGRFWNDPPQRYRDSYSYSERRSSKRRRDNVVLLPDQQRDPQRRAA